MTVVIREKKLKSRIKKLTEAITLQAIEDMCDPHFKESSIEFLRDGGLDICLRIIGLNYLKRKKLLTILRVDITNKGNQVSQ
jgi:hypothetical protein